MKRLNNKYGKNSKNNKFNKILHLEREKSRKASVSPQISQESQKWQGQGEPRESRYLKRLSNEYGKNNKFYEILHLEREKPKRGLDKVANFAKIAKVTRILLLREKIY